MSAELRAAEVKRHGLHYTPVELAAFLAARVVLHLPAGARIRVLDPACGDGELLFALQRQVLASRPGTVLDLVGYDLDPEALRQAAERATRLRAAAAWQQGDFLDLGRELASNSFEVVITNPPYVRAQQLGRTVTRSLAAEFGLTGRLDLTHPFVTRCAELLRPGGVLGLLCSNRFLTTKAGANVRAVLQTALSPVEVYDLGDTRLFGAAVLPAITIAVNSPAETVEECRFSSAYELPSGVADVSGSLFDQLAASADSIVAHDRRAFSVRVGALVRSTSHVDPWRISHVVGDRWLRSVQAGTWRTFGEIAKIRVGIKTTADSVFISQDWDELALKPEAELLVPLITHHHVQPWLVSDHPATRVLYPYDFDNPRRTLLAMQGFPQAMRYLESHAERLRARSYVTASGREWHEIWVAQQPSRWRAPKIVFPDISENPRFAYDVSGAVVNGDCYWISLEDIQDEDVAYLMMGVANSGLGVRFYDEMCGNKLYAGRRRWMAQYVARLPLPDPSSQAAGAVVGAVKQLLASAVQPNPSALAELDNLVAAAFADPLQDPGV